MPVFAIIGALIAVALVVEAIRQYRKTPGTAFVSAFYNSATVALARVVQIVSAALMAVLHEADNLAGLITDPSTSDAIKGVVAQYKPEATTIAVLVIALAGAFEAARRRSLGKDQ